MRTSDAVLAPQPAVSTSHHGTAIQKHVPTSRQASTAETSHSPDIDDSSRRDSLNPSNHQRRNSRQFFHRSQSKPVSPSPAQQQQTDSPFRHENDNQNILSAKVVAATASTSTPSSRSGSRNRLVGGTTDSNSIVSTSRTSTAQYQRRHSRRGTSLSPRRTSRSGRARHALYNASADSSSSASSPPAAGSPPFRRTTMTRRSTTSSYSSAVPPQFCTLEDAMALHQRSCALFQDHGSLATARSYGVPSTSTSPRPKRRDSTLYDSPPQGYSPTTTSSTPRSSHDHHSQTIPIQTCLLVNHGVHTTNDDLPNEPYYNPQPTTIHWLSPSTRARQYAEIDRWTTGLRGMLRRVAPRWFFRHAMVTFYDDSCRSKRKGYGVGGYQKEEQDNDVEHDDDDDDAGSVRRYRLVTEEASEKRVLRVGDVDDDEDDNEEERRKMLCF